LTGIYNRQRMDHLLTIEVYRAQRYQRPLAVIMVDIDHFKDVNDSYGHDAGDRMLQEIAVLLAHSTRETDFVGRWGGEEFLIVSPETNLKEAVRLAERLRQQIAGHSFKEVGHKTISLGVAEFREGDSREDFLKRSDIALYKAKQNGRDRVEH
jgi:polar amino acid transport system substrate-binding protein